MKPSAFKYVRCETVPEALGALAEHGYDSKVIAGGQSLVPMMNLRLATPAVLVDINRIPELGRLSYGEGMIEIGATVRHTEVEHSPVIAASVPLMPEALRHVGHVAIRNRGTIGGSIAHADSAAEIPMVAVLLGAEMLAEGPNGGRTIAAEDFFRSYYTTTLGIDELLVRVRFPMPPLEAGTAFVEAARRHGDFALAAAAAMVSVDSEGRCTSARIVMGAVADVPLRAPAAERILVGSTLDERTVREASQLATADLEPRSDVHVSGEHRRRVAAALVRRAVAQATARVGGI